MSKTPIANNNIECISPSGKVFYTHKHWLEKFLSLLNSGYIEEARKLRDGSIKLFKVWSFSPYLKFKEVCEFLEEGDTIVLNNWKFKVV